MRLRGRGAWYWGRVPEAFKDKINGRGVAKLGAALARAERGFDAAAFARAAERGLGRLELKARVQHVATAIARALPREPMQALGVLERAGRALRLDETDRVTMGFVAWPLIDAVPLVGMAHPKRALEVLLALTPLFSAEFAVRPFLREHPKLTLRALGRACGHADPHVRRLVSEGTRPRLPWGGALEAFVRDPTPTLALLERLEDDPSEYVRRSVANHLNDISKDHPDRAVATCRAWMKRPTPARSALVRHALRTLVKAGDARALELLGHAPAAAVEVRGLRVAPSRVAVGDSLEICFEIRSRASTATSLVVDYAVHHVKKAGHTTAKVFKLRRFALEPGETRLVRKQHSLRAVTTRRYYPGRHVIEILVNGSARARATFELSVPSGGKGRR